MSDTSDLESTLSGKEPEVAPEEPIQAEAPVAEAPVEEPKVEKAEEPKQDVVPVAVVQELRKELRELKAMQPRPEPKPAPDFYEDPQGAFKHAITPIEQTLTKQKLEQSRWMAEREFGADVVQAAFDYFDAHPEQSQQLINHPSPFHAAVEFYNQQQVASQIGKDPQAWITAKEAELRKKIEAELVAKQARDAAGKFAPSMADVTGTGGGPKTNWTGPTPLDAIIGN